METQTPNNYLDSLLFSTIGNLVVWGQVVWIFWDAVMKAIVT